MLALVAGCQTIGPQADVAPVEQAARARVVALGEAAVTASDPSVAPEAAPPEAVHLASAGFAQAEPAEAEFAAEESVADSLLSSETVPDPGAPEPPLEATELTLLDRASAEEPSASLDGSDDPPRLPQPSDSTIGLGDVLASVFAHYPLLDAAYRDRTVADGYQLAAEGEFDTKIKASSDNQPLYFYENYVQRAAVEQPLYNGGQLFGQYRIGRGEFEPWYLERETNKGGEFRAGIMLPLLQGREIDARRAELWKAGLDRASVEPEIQQQLLEFSREAAYAYWDWLAAGQYYEIAQTLFENSVERTEGVRRRVEEGELEPIASEENERLILSRRATLIEAERKLTASGIYLSLFLRDVAGQPYRPNLVELPQSFPPPQDVQPQQAELATNRALEIRPELQVLAFERRRLDVDLRWARNQLLPELDAGLVGAQDVGEPTSSKRDKSEFELEVGVVIETPLQFRKARGYTAVAEGKLAQLNAKTRFTRDKISTEVRSATVALAASYRRYEQMQQSLEIARQLEEADIRRFEEGAIDLFALNLREQLTADAAATVVTAQLDYHRALADFCAAIGEFPASSPAATPPPAATLPLPPSPSP